MPAKKNLTDKQRDQLLTTLAARFDENMQRHKGIKWADVAKRLQASPEKLWSLHEMESTGGEPDVVAIGKRNEITFVDCAKETPKGRRSICYDGAALKARKEHKPETSAQDMAQAMGVELLTEEQYRVLQQLGEFDLATSSWIQTPKDVRELGGALFCDRRYGKVFTYHNGAQSYYAARAFRAALKV